MCRGVERGGKGRQRKALFQGWEDFPLNHSVTLWWIPPSAFPLHGSPLSPVFPEMAPEEEFFPAYPPAPPKKERNDVQ